MDTETLNPPIADSPATQRGTDRALLTECAGLLNLIAQGMAPENVRDQANALLEKIGQWQADTTSPPDASDR